MFYIRSSQFQAAVFMIAALLLSLILHELGHGFVALKCGDPTAKMMGRLSLDPRKHLDPIGAICMFFPGIGWAKPVPINPYNFRRRDRDRPAVVLKTGEADSAAVFLQPLRRIYVSRVAADDRNRFYFVQM